MTNWIFKIDLKTNLFEKYENQDYFDSSDVRNISKEVVKKLNQSTLFVNYPDGWKLIVNRFPKGRKMD